MSAHRADDISRRACELFLESEACRDYLRRVWATDPGYDPYLSYVGVNFQDGAIKNIKLYFSYYRRLTPVEIERLLPVPDRGHFDRLYAQWEPAEKLGPMHRGVTFALKIDADGEVTHYYHLRVPGMPFGPPERLELAASDLGAYHGACEELTAGRRHLKRYYYAEDRETIRRSLERFGFSDRSAAVEVLEYIESEGRDKYAWVSRDRRLSNELVTMHGWPELQTNLDQICKDCGFMLFAPGSSVDRRDHSLYFWVSKEELIRQRGQFDGVRVFAERHLKLRGASLWR